MFNIYRYETAPQNLAAGFDTQTRFSTSLQYVSVFHCCVDVGVLISEEQGKVVLRVDVNKCLHPAW